MVLSCALGLSLRAATPSIVSLAVVRLVLSLLGKTAGVETLGPAWDHDWGVGER